MPRPIVRRPELRQSARLLELMVDLECSCSAQPIRKQSCPPRELRTRAHSRGWFFSCNEPRYGRNVASHHLSRDHTPKVRRPRQASTARTCKNQAVSQHEHVAPELETATKRGAGTEVAAPGRSHPLLGLQRSIGNQAVLSLISTPADTFVLSRKIAKSLDPTTSGPAEEILDSALSGDQQTNASDTLSLIKGGTGFDDHPYVAARASQNAGKVPNSVKRGMKWKWPHRNNSGHLPGVPGAGGYDEYYVNTGPICAGPPTALERLVVNTATKDVFHTATHYGDQGSPAFTQFGTAT